MNRLISVSSLAVGLLTAAAFASPVGTEILVNVHLDSSDSDWNVVDEFRPFDWSVHTLGGPDTLLISNYDFVTDVLVTSSVTMNGNQRTINVDFFSVTGGNIFQAGHEAFLDPSDLYWVTFFFANVDDPERAGPVTYGSTLRDVGGNDVHGQAIFDGFFGGWGYLDSPSLASDKFFGIAVNGFSISMTYLIPSPSSIVALGLAGLVGLRRSR